MIVGIINLIQIHITKQLYRHYQEILKDLVLNIQVSKKPNRNLALAYNFNKLKKVVNVERLNV